MLCSVCHTANAGVYVTAGSVRFLLDAFPDKPVDGFEAMTPPQVETLLRGISPDLLLVTHPHPDHHSDRLTRLAADRFPGMEIVCPWRRPSAQLLWENCRVRWFPLPHAPQEVLQQVPNYGFLLETEGRRIFCPGDADPRDAQVRRLVEGLRPDLAILNFPWVTLPSARPVLAALDPRHTVLTHLPPADCDPLALHRAVETALPRLHDTVMLDGFLQTADFDL